MNPLEMTKPTRRSRTAACGTTRPRPADRARRRPVDRQDAQPDRGRAGARRRTTPTSSPTRCRACRTGGTGAAPRSRAVPVAGKTGTAKEYVDAWFCGYTVQLATCVWVGYPEDEIPLVDIEGSRQVFGGTIPAAIWHDFMTDAMEGLELRPRVPGADLRAATRSGRRYRCAVPTPPSPPSLSPSPPSPSRPPSAGARPTSPSPTDEPEPTDEPTSPTPRRRARPRSTQPRGRRLSARAATGLADASRATDRAAASP